MPKKGFSAGQESSSGLYPLKITNRVAKAATHCLVLNKSKSTYYQCAFAFVNCLFWSSQSTKQDFPAFYSVGYSLHIFVTYHMSFKTRFEEKDWHKVTVYVLLLAKWKLWLKW